MREARLSRGLSLHQVERVCKVRWEFLQAIEQENWDYIPTTEQRRAIRLYGEYLGEVSEAELFVKRVGFWSSSEFSR